MKGSVYTLFLSMVVLGLASRAMGQNPSFHLSLDAPASVTGNAGSQVQYAVTGKLTTTGLAASDPGAQGWSLSMSSAGSAIVEVTTAGTVGADVSQGGLRDSGFEQTELTSGAGNEGAMSAVVLSFRKPISLPPSGTVDIVKLTIEATVPNPGTDPSSGDPRCDPLTSRVIYIDGREGSGEPVDNKITYKGETVRPTLADASTTVCPIITRPLNLRVEVLSPAGSAAEKSAGKVPWNIDVPVGSTDVPVTVGVVLSSNLDQPDGVQGWSISVATDPCFNISAATTAGTVGANQSEGGLEDEGFALTELAVPEDNSGQEGAVSAVVLSFRKPITLPPVGDSLILRVMGSLDASGIAAGGETTSPCCVTITDENHPGLSGSGEAVPTAFTVRGRTRNPGVCGAAIQLTGELGGRFVRGNANDDSKLDIADAVWIINELFRSGPPTLCQDAADANNDGNGPDLSDALYIVAYQFQGGSAPPEPFPIGDCGMDPEGDGDGITCAQTQSDC